MIDLFDEQIISLERASNELSKILDRKITKSAVTRWANEGNQGVVLETCLMGTQRYTSKEALVRFAHNAEQARRQQRRESTKNGQRKKLSPAAQKQVDARLKQLGVKKGGGYIL